MAIKFLSGLNLSNVTAGSILKLDSSGNIVAAVDGTDYNTGSADSWSATGSDIYRNSDVRIGTYQSGVAPSARLHVFDYQTTDPKLLIEDGNTGDASMQFKISTQSYTMGIDNSDSDKFIIANAGGFNLAANTHALEISTAGKVTIPAHTTNGAVRFEVGGFNRLRFNSGIDLLGYTSDHLWVIGNSTTNTINLGADWDWDKQVAISYTPNTVGGAGGVMILGQTEKNNANWTHGTTKLYTNGTERLRIDSNGNVGIGVTAPATDLSLGDGTHTSPDDTDRILNWYSATGGDEISNSSHYITVGQSSSDTTQPKSVGLALFNQNTANNTYSPAITFGGLSTSGDYMNGAAAIAAQLISNTNDNNFRSGELTFYTQGTTTATRGLTERMRIDGSGNVGIGTTSPQQKLHVEGNIYLGPNNTNNFVHSGAALGIQADGDIKIVSDVNDTSGVGGTDIIFGYGSSTNTDSNQDFTESELGTYPRVELMRLDASTDRVGIGTATPDFKLDVAGDIGMSGKLYHNGDHNTYIGFGGDIQSFRTGGTDRMTITNSGIGIGTASPSFDLDVSGSARITGNIWGTNRTSLLHNFVTDASYEGNAFYNPETFNAFAGADKWSTITITNAYQSNRTTSISSLSAAVFQVGGNTWQPYFNTAEDDMVIEIDHTSEPLRYGGHIGIQWTNSGWSARNVKIEVYNGTSWTTIKDITGNTATTVVASHSASAAGVQKTKFTLGDPNNSSGGYMRISKIFGTDYKGNSSYDVTRSGTYYLEKFVDNQHYSNIYPAVDSTYTLGTSAYQYSRVYTDTLYSPTVRVSGTNDHLTLRSDVQVDQGATDPIIEFAYGTTQMGKFDQDGYMYATGFKTTTASTGFLKADGSVDTTTYASGSDYLALAGGTMTGDLTIPAKIIHSGDTNTYFLFGTDTITLTAGGYSGIAVESGIVKSHQDFVVTGGETFALGERAEPDDNGRTVLIEGAASGSAGEGSGRIFFTEHNSTTASADKYGLSLYYEGNPNALLPSGFQPNTGNATWSLRRHDNSVNGAAIMSGTRSSSDVLFGGKISITTADANTTSTTALVLNGTEVEKRTLGSNAFTSTTIPTGTAASKAVTDFIQDFGTAAQSNINTIGAASGKYRWNNSTTGRPASSQSNEYGTLLHLNYDGSYATQLAYDIDQSNLYIRHLALATDTGSTWKRIADTGYVDSAVANLVDSAPAALDTLNELAAALGDDANFSTTMSTALGNRLRIDVNNQNLSSTELSNARTNLGLGTAATSAATDFVDLSSSQTITGDKTFSSNSLTLKGHMYFSEHSAGRHYIHFKAAGSTNQVDWRIQTNNTNTIVHSWTNTNALFRTNLQTTGTVTATKYLLTVNAPTNVTTSVVNETINVTFDASTTSDIDYYLVFSSVAGGDYGLISVIPPADFGATMSIIDNSFDSSGTQAYRVYAVKNGVYSSPATASRSYTVTTPLEPTNMSVVNLNSAYYIQWDKPSTNARFVTAYNVYKHEAAAQASLSRNSATLIYSGTNTSYMYQISGTDNNNYHQFWVETTVG